LDTVSIKSTRDPVVMSTSPTLSNQATTHLRLIGISLISASLGWQLLQLNQPHGDRASAESPTYSPQVSPATASAAALAQLFAQPANTVEAAPIGSTMRLLACFAGSDSRQSSALLAIDGQPTRRVHTGQQVMPGVQVAAIHAQSIDITGNGQVYRLRLGRSVPVPVSQQSAAFNSFTLPSISSITGPE
jgi:general secretion pathway protein C